MNFIEAPCGKSIESQEIHCFYTQKKFKNYIYLIGGVHGDEVEGVCVTEKLFQWLKENDDLNLPLIVIPILNVDGYRQGSRVNSNGVDLNRNLPTSTWEKNFKEDKYNPGPSPGSEPENAFLIKTFEKYPPGFILTMHSWKPILNYNGDCKDIADFISKYNKYPIADDIGYPTPGSLGTYAPEKFSAPVLTYELPTLDQGKSLEEIWLENKEGLTELFKSDLIKTKIQLD